MADQIDRLVAEYEEGKIASFWEGYKYAVRMMQGELKAMKRFHKSEQLEDDVDIGNLMIDRMKHRLHTMIQIQRMSEKGAKNEVT